MNRLSRLISILSQLQAKRLLTFTELSKKYGVSVRTIYRDIRSLEDSGIPIYTEEGKGYSLIEGYIHITSCHVTKDKATIVTR